VENVSPVLQEASLRQFFGAVGTVKRLQWTTRCVRAMACPWEVELV
jgi:hypothetical protein